MRFTLRPSPANIQFVIAALIGREAFFWFWMGLVKVCGHVNVWCTPRAFKPLQGVLEKLLFPRLRTTVEGIDLVVNGNLQESYSIVPPCIQDGLQGCEYIFLSFFFIN